MTPHDRDAQSQDQGHERRLAELHERLITPGDEESHDASVEPEDTELREAAELFRMIERVRDRDQANQRTETFSDTHPQTKGSSVELSPGTEFGDYEIIREIARGGMGVVFRARQVSLRRIVALKTILAAQLVDRDQVRRFRAEAEAVAQLDHPGIVPIYEVGERQGTHYFSMKLVEEGSLSEAWSARRPDARVAAEIVRQVAAAVQFAHTRNIVHRDLKPSNVLIDADAGPMVTDFGLAKDVSRDSGLTLSGVVMGTPSYMAPEQASGQLAEVGPLADVYALGGILYFLLTGNPPFAGSSSIDTINCVLRDNPVHPRHVNPSCNSDLATISLKCLRKDPAHRYASASELADDISRFLDGRPITARPVSSRERAWKWVRRNPLVAAMVTLSVIALGGYAWYQTLLASANAENNRLLYSSSVDMAEFLTESRPDGYGRRAWDLVDQARRIELRERDEQRLRQLAVNSLGARSSTRPLHIRGLDSRVSQVDVTPDDRFLFVGLESGELVIVDLSSGEQVHRFAAHQPSGSGICAIRFPDSQTALTSTPFCREILRWERDSHDRWKLTGPLKFEQTDEVLDVWLTPDGQHVVGIGPTPGGKHPDVEMDLWSNSFTRLEPLFPAEARLVVRSLVDNERVMIDHPIPWRTQLRSIGREFVAFGETDNDNESGRNEVYVFRLRDGQQVQRFSSACGILASVHVSPDGSRVACGGHLGISIHDLRSGDIVSTYDRAASTTQFFGDNLVSLITGDARQVVLTAEDAGIVSNRKVKDWKRNRFSSTGGHHLDVTEEDALVVTNLRPPERFVLQAHDRITLEVAYSPDGQILATTTSGLPSRLWSTRTWQLVTEIDGSIAFHPSGRILAARTAQGIELWSLPHGRLLASLAKPLNTTRSSGLGQLEFNARGDLLAYGGVKSGSLFAWKVTGLTNDAESVDESTVRIEQRLHDPEGLLPIAWSPDGGRLAWGSKEVRAYDFATDRLVKLSTEATYQRSLFFRTENELGIGARPIDIWNVDEDRRIATASTVAFAPLSLSPDRQLLIADLSLYRTDNLERLITLPRWNSKCWCAAWSPDGRQVACSFDGGEVVIWDLAEVHRRLSRIDLQWSPAVFGDVAPMQGITELATSGPERFAELQTWGETLARVNAWIATDAGPYAELTDDCVWLVEHLPANVSIPFVPDFDRRPQHQQIIALGRQLRQRQGHDACEAMMQKYVTLLRQQTTLNDQLRYRLATALHILGDLYCFDRTDQKQAGAEALSAELELVNDLLSKRPDDIQQLSVRSQVFWAHHNLALALASLGRKADAIPLMARALELHEEFDDVDSGIVDWELKAKMLEGWRRDVE